MESIQAMPHLFSLTTVIFVWQYCLYSIRRPVKISIPLNKLLLWKNLVKFINSNGSCYAVIICFSYCQLRVRTVLHLKICRRQLEIWWMQMPYYLEMCSRASKMVISDSQITNWHLHLSNTYNTVIFIIIYDKKYCLRKGITLQKLNCGEILWKNLALKCHRKLWRIRNKKILAK